MPATEQTWRNQKAMHLVFGLSSLAMLATTVWLLAVDHNREWKQDQIKFQGLEAWTKDAQLAETSTPSFFGEAERLDWQLYEQQMSPPSETLVNRFLAEVLYDRYLTDLGKQKKDGSPTLRDQMARLRSVPLSELAQPENQKLLSDVLSDLKQNVRDDTGIVPSYENLLKDTPKPAGGPAQPVATSTPTPSPTPERAADAAKDAAAPKAAADKKDAAPAKEAAPAAESSQEKIDPDLRKKVAKERQALFDKMRAIIAQVKFVEDMTAGQRKFRRADLDAARSKLDVAVRDDEPQAQRDEYQGKINQILKDVDVLTAKYERAVAQRRELENVLKSMTGPEELAQKNLADFEAKRDVLRKAVDDQNAKFSNLGRDVIEMPILDAFSSRLRIEQIWLPKLTLNNNFRDVARYDRCTTCHLGIEKTAAGSAVAPSYPPQEAPQVVELATPKTAPPADGPGKPSARSTQELYGLQLSKYGPVHPTDVTIEVVWPRTPAARAGLLRGDVIRAIEVGGRSEKIVRVDQALRFMVQEPEWGKPLKLTIVRGVPQPFSSHPRLDLFVGSMSPHKLQSVGCTICHQGQGSATSFQWASHTPNTLKQQSEWEHEYGYSANHHWIYPMYPDRFIESSCLKCHHDVVDLKPSQRFPDPPAPKVMAGFELISKVGCFGCHEVIGYDGPKRVGPDLRNEPLYYAAAAALEGEVPPRLKFFDGMRATKDAAIAAIADKSLEDLAEMQKLSAQVSTHPDDAPTRLRLLELVNIDVARTIAPDKLLTDPGLTVEMLALAQELQAKPDDLLVRDKLVKLLEADQKSSAPQLKRESHDLIPALKRPPELTAATQKLADQLKTVEVPGTMRKVGPSLRHVASKLGEDTINRWVYNPRSIRDTTKMPRFFGLMDKLTPGAAKTASLYEPIEARAIAQYLVDRSQPFAYDKVSSEVTEEPSAQRGELLFKTRGCLACHKHSAVPESAATFAPDLTGLEKKIDTADGKEWLRSWLRHPDRYHLRTAMPYNFLDPIKMTDEKGQPLKNAEGKDRMSDPAADIALWLLGPKWEPVPDKFTSLGGDATKQEDVAALDALAREYLITAFPEAKAKEYLAQGIPADVAPSLKGAEIELVGEMTLKKKLDYVGRRAISKYGCSGCHDIPGFESARPIGTGLADWGRKETSKLAFEHILEYLPKEQAELVRAAREEREKRNGVTADTPQEASADAHTPQEHDASPHAAEHEELDPADWGPEGYFLAALLEHHREGFLWQKLRQPRSYDYQKTENKGYNEWLRMPQFNLTADEREQIMTFVLGLVTEPPAAQYIYRPDARKNAIIDGERVLMKFNCAGCHMLETAQWKVQFAPGTLDTETPPAAIPPYLEPYYSPDEILQSKQLDRRGLMTGTVRGMQTVNDAGHPEVQIYWKADKDSDPEFMAASELQGQTIGPDIARGYPIELWHPTLLSGAPLLPKDPMPLLSTQLLPKNPQIVAPPATPHGDWDYPPRGGEFARLLLPIAIATQNQGKGADAWAWGPPPLVGQGRKTQPEWLHDFLLDPQRIRPGVILRMPRFNMSSDDSATLVQYFAARDNMDYPHQYARDDRRAQQAANKSYEEKLKKDGQTGTRLGDAEKIMLSKSGCITCHLVEDFVPQGSDRALGPNLANVHRRLQPEYVKHWIAKPSLKLPYTKMPVNFPYDPKNPAQDGFWEQVPGTKDRVQPYHGSSLEQIDAVTDLLMNWDSFLQSQTSIKQKVEAAGPATPATPAGAATPAGIGTPAAGAPSP